MNELKNLKNKKVHVVGISGMEGWAVTKFLLSKGAIVIGHDFADKDQAKANFYNLRDYLSDKEKDCQWQEFDNLKIEIYYKQNYLKEIDQADLIFLPQSWFRYDFNDPIKNVRKKIATIGIIDLYLSCTKAKVIGITGSNGKSTTSRMVQAILKSKTDSKVLLSGNDRENLPVLDQAEKLNKNDYLVLEVSNRQLKDFNRPIDIGLVTNVSPTHLDDHNNSFDNYLASKGNLIRNQEPNQQAVLNFDDSSSQKLAKLGKGDKYFFSLKERVDKGCFIKDSQAYFVGENEPIFDVDKLQVPGIHNLANALSASCIGKLCQVANADIAKALYCYKGSKHRLELVGRKDGVSYINDSQSTNPASTVAGLRSFRRPIILILGGKKKPNEKDFDLIVEEVANNDFVKKVILIGESGGQIFNRFKANQVSTDQLIKANKLSGAVKLAKSFVKNGDVVLLSPGSESFGEFRDYRERGEKFKKLVEKG